MSAVIKLLAAILWMVVIPVLTGLLPCAYLPKDKRRLPVICLSGYFLSFAVFELIGLPILLFTELGDIVLFVRIYAAAECILAAAGVFAALRSGGIACSSSAVKSALKPEKINKLTALLWTVFALLLLFEFYMAYTHATFDGDDAYYVTQSLLSWKTDTMYRYLPYTGITTDLDYRHALAMFPMWFTFLARMSGTHPTIITHSLTPILMLSLTDIIYAGIGAKLIGKQEHGERLPAFMILIALLQIFGNVSIYTPETFLLMRSWQGKSVLANILLPAVVLILLSISRSLEEDGEELKFLWLLLLLLSFAAGLFTSMAPLLTGALIALGSLGLGISFKNKGVVIRGWLCCLPSLFYLLLTFYFM